MINPQKSNYAEKSAYYSNDEVVQLYELKRYSGWARWVKEAEQEVIRKLLHAAKTPSRNPNDLQALDCPCGTGLWEPLLQQEGYSIHAVDQSSAMLMSAARHHPSSLHQASAEALPFEGGTFDLVFMHRFVFHFEDPEPFIREASRVLRVGGHLLFDFCSWTPRAIRIPLVSRFLGGKTYVHSESEISSLASRVGLQLEICEEIFALPPYLYRWIPQPMALLIERLFQLRALQRFKSKRYVLLRRVEK